jgi:hypothetical protein
MIKKSNRHFNLVHMPQIQASAKKWAEHKETVATTIYVNYIDEI